MSFTYSSYRDYRSRLTSGEFTCRQVVDHYLNAIREKAALNCYLETFDDLARNQADQVQKKLADGTAGPLAGMVIAVKDVLTIEGQITSCASKILKNHRAVYHSTVVKKLIEADAILIGRTNMDEFAMGSSNENSAFGPVRHPMDPERVPGGSSGGSAVAVAAGLAMASLGTDTGGSIRFPAALCGIVGLKPTYGRVSRFGLIAYASSFDQVGPFTHSVEDAALIMEVLAGHDPLDSTSAPLPVPGYAAGLNKPVGKLRVGIPDEYLAEGLNPEIKNRLLAVADRLKSEGATVTSVKLPHTPYCIATYYILTTAEASSNLARYDGVRFTSRAEKPATLNAMYVKSRSEGFGPEVKRRIMLGTYVLSAGYYDAYYAKAQKVRRLIRQDFEKAFESVDVLLTPTTPGTAFRIGEKTTDPLEMYLSDIFTVSANLAGIPGVSIPAGLASDGLPIGVQLLGNHFDEATLLTTARAIETFKF
ncbi:MAG: Asp-tRNA(Asn)/Glu-tRNA(Gln) amidotransferase subunit GatA [Bacteroidetes bacterium]|nr:Asp-tRNA(Asn)/Glu-tRNA(Gln) amidotransferase subunit GatA [Bacteroidota bacterium]